MADDDDSDGYFYDTDHLDDVNSPSNAVDDDSPLEKTFTVLNESDIRHCQNEQVSNITSLLSVSIPEAGVLLCHYKWNASKLVDDWLDNEEIVRNKVGLLAKDNSKQLNLSRNKFNCGICFVEGLRFKKVCSASCDEHYYCLLCWKKYIKASVNDSGLGCLTLRCPEPNCPAIVGQDMVCNLAYKKDQQKYLNYFIRSYVEYKENTRWCPRPGCDLAIELEHGNIVGYDVTCDCSNTFCWNCGEECHRPVKCDIVMEWITKNNSEAENTNWILAYTKPCPKCKRAIEKNQGCSHMTCSAPCGHRFCWLCLGDLKNHVNCNGYTAKKMSDEDKRKRARVSLIRYAHYYERWASNHKSWQKSIEDLHKCQTIQLPMLSERISQPKTKLQFIVQAWEQIVECRRVLKWTYAYGYFLPEHEYAKKQFFEFLQGDAQAGLERLHHCAEIELTKHFLVDDGSEITGDIQKFREKLTELTKVTGTYFKNLVRGLENDLPEVVCEEPSSSIGTSNKEVRDRKRKRTT